MKGLRKKLNGHTLHGKKEIYKRIIEIPKLERHHSRGRQQELSKVFRGSTQSYGIETVENGNSRLR